MNAEELIGAINETLNGDVDDNAPERADMLNDLVDMLKDGRLQTSGESITITWGGHNEWVRPEQFDEATKPIEEALGDGYFVGTTLRAGILGVFERIPREERSDPQDDSRLVGALVPGARIRIEGDSFAVLPPEVKPDGM